MIHGRPEDEWAAYRGKYPDPTQMELYLIRDFLVKFAFEDDDFVEDLDQRWTQLKDRLRCPNLRTLLITFLRQVRQTKGYDVDDLHLDFSGAGANWSFFVPRRLDERKCYEEAMAASMFAIGEINAQLMRSYEVVSVDKLVSTTPDTDKYNWMPTFSIMLLSFTAKEKEIDVPECFQAMVYPNTPSSFHLHEWKFNPNFYKLKQSSTPTFNMEIGRAHV